MKRLALVFVAVLALAGSSPGCAAVVSYLPTAIAYAQDGAMILDTIQRFVDAFFVNHPNPDRQKQVNQAAARAHAALDLALRAATGAQDLNQAKVDAAFEEFRQAYVDLLALVGPMGVSSGGARLAAAPGGGLVVPEPLALVRRK